MDQIVQQNVSKSERGREKMHTMRGCKAGIFPLLSSLLLKAYSNLHNTYEFPMANDNPSLSGKQI